MKMWDRSVQTKWEACRNCWWWWCVQWVRAVWWTLETEDEGFRNSLRNPSGGIWTVPVKVPHMDDCSSNPPTLKTPSSFYHHLVGKDLKDHWAQLLPNTAKASSVPIYHTYMSFKCLQGWWLNHFTGQPVPALNEAFGKEIFSTIQSEPPLAQLEAFPLPVTVFLGEGADPHLSTASF